MKNIIKLVVLTLALSVGVFAQFEPNEPAEAKSIRFLGDQSVAGEFVDATQKVEGNSFVLNGTSKEYKSILLTVAFDYNGLPDYNTGNELTGGLWNLAVYTKGGDYKGSIYGTVTAGSISWSVFEDFGKRARASFGSGSTRNTRATLTITGGTGDFYDVRNSDVRFEADSDISTGSTTALMNDLQF